MDSTDTLSAGLRALPNKISSFASTQAAWRFYKNESVTLFKLQEPLLIAAHNSIAMHCSTYALCVHDQSRLNYRKHTSKLDKYQITHDTDVGYGLHSNLILSDQTEQPLAPAAQRLVTAEGSYATYQDSELSETVENHLNEVTHCINKLEGQNFPKPVDTYNLSFGTLWRAKVTPKILPLLGIVNYFDKTIHLGLTAFEVTVIQ